MVKQDHTTICAFINSIKMATKLDVNQTEQILPLMVTGLNIFKLLLPQCRIRNHIQN